MPDSISVFINTETQRPPGGYSLTDSLLAQNEASAQGLHPAPQPFDLATDDATALLLFAAFLLTIIYIVRMRARGPALLEAWTARGGELEAAQPPSPLWGAYLFTAGLPLGILTLCLAVQRAPEALKLLPAPWMLAVGVAAVFWLAIVVKTRVYRLVNAVFCTRSVGAQWNLVAYSAAEASGLLLFPLALLAVYLPLSVESIAWGGIVILGFAKLALLLRALRTFSAEGISVIHIIVYFCALEVIPLLLLWHLAEGYAQTI